MLDSQRSAAIHVSNTEPIGYQLAPAPEPYTSRTICLVLVVALVLNAAIVLVVLAKAASPMAETYSMDFGDLYDLIAKSLDQGSGYRVDPTMGNTMLREPGYPLLLAAVFKVGGYGIQQARVVCVLLAFGAALFLLQLTRKITGDMMTALAAAILFLLYPGILVAEARAGIEIPSIFTVLLFMLVLYSALESKLLWRYFVAGLLLGVAVMVRSEVLLFPSFLLLWLLITAKRWVEARKVVVSIAALAVGAVLAMSPWIVRNYLLVHEFVPTATVAGVAAQEGLFTCESSLPGEPFFAAQRRAGYERVNLATSLGKPFTGPYYQLFYTPKDEVAFNHALLNKVSTEYRSHPDVLAKCAAKNLFFNFWFLGKRQHSTMLNMILQTPLIALGVTGAFVLWKRGLMPKAGIIVLYILYIPVLHAAIIAHSRHSMLVVPFLVILAAVCVVSTWRAVTTRTSSTSSRQRVATSVSD